MEEHRVVGEQQTAPPDVARLGTLVFAVRCIGFHMRLERGGINLGYDIINLLFDGLSWCLRAHNLD